MPQKVRIIGVPMDLGQSRRGVDMGPSALRGAGLQAAIKKLGHTVEDIGNLSVKQPEEMPVGEKRAKYLQEIAETCGDIAAGLGNFLQILGAFFTDVHFFRLLHGEIADVFDLEAEVLEAGLETCAA